MYAINRMPTDTCLRYCAYPNRFFGCFGRIDVEKEWLPFQFECGRSVRRLRCCKSLHGALDVPLADEAPRADIVAENLREVETKAKVVHQYTGCAFYCYDRPLTIRLIYSNKK